MQRFLEWELSHKIMVEIIRIINTNGELVELNETESRQWLLDNRPNYLSVNSFNFTIDASGDDIAEVQIQLCNGADEAITDPTLEQRTFTGQLLNLQTNMIEDTRPLQLNENGFLLMRFASVIAGNYAIVSPQFPNTRVIINCNPAAITLQNPLIADRYLIGRNLLIAELQVKSDIFSESAFRNVSPLYQEAVVRGLIKRIKDLATDLELASDRIQTLEDTVETLQNP